jgi:hypothetical protein
MGEQLRDGRAIWQQTAIPVIFRRAKGTPLLVKLPYAKDNFGWLRDDSQRRPHWNRQYKCWETPYAWLNTLVRRLLARYGRLYLIQPRKVLDKCAPACWEATGFECECSCMGQNHGSQSGAGWYVVSESFAFRWHDRELACRLIERPASGGAKRKAPGAMNRA